MIFYIDLRGIICDVFAAVAHQPRAHNFASDENTLCFTARLIMATSSPTRGSLTSLSMFVIEEEDERGKTELRSRGLESHLPT